MDPMTLLDLGERRLEELRRDASDWRDAESPRSTAKVRVRQTVGAFVVSAGLRIAGPRCG